MPPGQKLHIPFNRTHRLDFTGTITSKLPQAGTSIFAVMTALANEHKAINLAQGFPDFSCHPQLQDMVTRHMHEGRNQYAPMPGVPELRRAIADKTEHLYSAQYDPDTEITVVPGATYGIYACITAIVRENDEVIVITPAYDCYVPAIVLNGGKPVFSRMKFPNYAVDWDEVRKLISFRTRAIIINTPHNPTGTVLSAGDLMKLEKLVENTDIIVISDEVYEHIIFDGREHQSVARFPRLAERSFIISSFGKTYHTTGWKLGYVVAPARLTQELRKVHQFLVFSVNTPMQYAFAEILQDRSLYLDLPQFYQAKRDLFRQLTKASRFKQLSCEGTYFQLLGYEKISKEDDQEMAQRLTREFQIASIPVSVFYHQKTDNHVLRFCFAKRDETLQRAAEILCRI